MFSGIALNARGAVELIVASIGLEMGIIDRPLFSVLISVALLTTILSLVIAPLAARRFALVPSA